MNMERTRELKECDPCGFYICDGMNYYGQELCCVCESEKHNLGSEVWCINCKDADYEAHIQFEFTRMREEGEFDE